MLIKTGFLSEGSFAHRALKGLFSSVDTKMLRQCALVGKTPITNRAWKWFLARVHSEVSHEIGLASEGLVAQHAC